MNKIMLIVMTIALGSLSGCASNGASNGDGAPMVRGSTDGSVAASQRSAQTIAPITSYISNVR